MSLNMVAVGTDHFERGGAKWVETGGLSLEQKRPDVAKRGKRKIAQ